MGFEVKTEVDKKKLIVSKAQSLYLYQRLKAYIEGGYQTKAQRKNSLYQTKAQSLY